MRVILTGMTCFVMLNCFGQISVTNRRRNFQLPLACVPGTNALAITLLDGWGNTSNSNFYASNPVTPATNSTLILFAATGPSATETVTNTGTTQLVWRRLASTNYNTTGTPINRLVAWATQLPQGLAPFSMTAVVSIASGVGIDLHLIQVTGADQTAAYGTNAVVQSVAFAVNASANPTNLFVAPGNNAKNSLLLAVADDVNSAADNAPTLNWTELAETSFTTTATGLASYYTNTASLLVTATNTATSRDWATILVELKAGTNCLAQ